MADVNIFEKYGIKQVANVYFEALKTDTKAGVYEGDIVLYLDTLKVSTIETTAENVAAQGGWGNPRLIQWDYGKEINITLTDALISLESLKFMLGGALKKPSTDAPVLVHRTAESTVRNGKVSAPIDSFTKGPAYPWAWKNHPIKVLNLTKGWRTQIDYQEETEFSDEYNAGAAKALWTDTYHDVTFKNSKLLENEENGKHADDGDVLRFFWVEEHADSTKNDAIEITISSDTFPGTYRVVGDTFIRDTSGKDVPFQFIIEQAKVQSNVTITLEAEGDPSTFDMTLNVLRASTGHDMMRLVRYGDAEDEEETGNDWGSIDQYTGSNVAMNKITQTGTYTLVSSPVDDNIGDYYIKSGGLYFKVSTGGIPGLSSTEVVAGIEYYTYTNSATESDNG